MMQALPVLLRLLLPPVLSLTILTGPVRRRHHDRVRHDVRLVPVRRRHDDIGGGGERRFRGGGPKVRAAVGSMDLKRSRFVLL